MTILLTSELKDVETVEQLIEIMNNQNCPSQGSEI